MYKREAGHMACLAHFVKEKYDCVLMTPEFSDITEQFMKKTTYFENTQQ